MTDKEAMNVASQCRATASADLCKKILVDGGSGFLFELLLDAAKAIETLAQEKALQVLHNENERLGLYKDVYTEPVAQYSDIVSDGGLDPRNKFDVQPQRTWVGLTDEEILSDDTLRYYYGMNGGAGPVSQKGKKVIAAIEAKLKQKNGYAEEKNT